MKRGIALVVAAIVGVFLAGVVAPLVILVLPSELRGQRIVLGIAAAVVAITTAVGWLSSSPRAR